MRLTTLLFSLILGTATPNALACPALNVIAGGSKSWSEIYAAFVDAGRDQNLLTTAHLESLAANPLAEPAGGWSSSEIRELHRTLVAALPIEARSTEIAKAKALLSAQLEASLAGRTESRQTREANAESRRASLPAALEYRLTLPVDGIERSHFYLLPSAKAHVHRDRGVMIGSEVIAPLPAITSFTKKERTESPEERFYLMSDGEEFQLWDSTSGAVTQLTPNPTHTTWLAEKFPPTRSAGSQNLSWHLTADGTRAVFAMGVNRNRGTSFVQASVYDARTGERVDRLNLGSGEYDASSLSADGRHVFIAYRNKKPVLVRWRPGTKEKESVHLPSHVSDLAARPIDVNRVAVALKSANGFSHAVGIVDFEAKKVEGLFPIDGKPVFDFAGKYVMGMNSSGTSGALKLYEIATGTPRASVRVNVGTTRTSFTPDGKRIVVQTFLSGKHAFDPQVTHFDLETWLAQGSTVLLVGDEPK